jgi:hypothetical protein
MTAITKKVLNYQRVGEGLNSVVQSVAEMVYRYPAGRSGFTEEDGAEFLLRFYPRIKRLINRYRPTGSSFESYLRSTLRYQLKSLAAERTMDRIRFSAVSDAETSREVVGHGPSWPAEEVPRGETGAPAYASASAGSTPSSRRGASSGAPRKHPAHRPSALRLQPGGDRGTKITPGQAQRLLCMALRSSECLDSDLCARLARVVGCDPQWLEGRWQELRERMYELRLRQQRSRVSRDRAWFELRCVEEKLAHALPDERELLLAERERWAGKLERARTTLRKSLHGPTHLEIAEVLGIAKGTVDSGVFKARTELRNPEYRRRLATLLEAP